jgi:acyl-CoA hydrolase
MESKRVQDSRSVLAQVMLPSDANPAGNISGGTIMKYIDNAAAVAALRHARCNVVTVSMDRLSFHHPVFVGNLLTLKASLNLAANTSMEVGVRVEAEDLISGEIQNTASAYLTFVAVDKNGRPNSVPPLLPETDEDRRRNSEARKRRGDRISKSNTRGRFSGNDPAADPAPPWEVVEQTGEWTIE